MDGKGKHSWEFVCLGNERGLFYLTNYILQQRIFKFDYAHLL